MTRSRLPVALAALAALLLLLGACVSSSDRDEVTTGDADSSEEDRSDEDSNGDDSKDADSKDDDSKNDDTEDENSEGDEPDPTDSDDSHVSDGGDPPMGGDEFEWNGDCSEVDGPCRYGDDPELDALWDDCVEGDGQACDDLFYDSPVDSQYEEFGNSCGGRGFQFSCAEDG